MTLQLEDFHFFRGLLQRRAAIVLEEEKAYLVESRLSVLSHREGFHSLNALATHLRSNGDDTLQRKVVEAMTTNETSFFRDGHPFEGLRLGVFPELVRRRAAERCLSVWCAACSSGQEPYSVAMLLREHFPLLEKWNIRIIASDLSTDVPARARRGRYSDAEVNRGLPPRLLEKYFRRTEGDEWEIREDLRRMVEFRPINLIDAWLALPALDVVLLRNVLIYFDVPTKRTALERVRKVLRPDGYLLLGGSETTLNLHEGYDRVPVGPSICYRARPGAWPDITAGCGADRGGRREGRQSSHRRREGVGIMKIASVAEIKSHFSAFLKASEAGPVVVTRNGRPVAVIVGVQDEDEIERLLMAYSPRLQAILEESRKQIREGEVLGHEEFWAEVEASRGSKGGSQKRKARRTDG